MSHFEVETKDRPADKEGYGRPKMNLLNYRLTSAWYRAGWARGAAPRPGTPGHAKKSGTRAQKVLELQDRVKTVGGRQYGRRQ
jgi:hypothetical protein